ncbi:transcriptional regulator BetI [Amorphus sp. 3PC139-8]|uniref:choline-binding transcriptional repressor BetI n=1 Tax=Amorphus sp. 3PC139-8 TaxID=2735676 RepID=UPI00345D6DA2
MPKVGVEAVRKDALVRAAIGAIGEVGSLDVTVAAIARRAGVSAALAHHYFGSKDTLFLAAMRRILEDFGRSVQAGYHRCRTPRERIHAVIEACFDEEQFDPAVVSAWLSFYVMAQRSPEAARLLAVYRKRLDSNLVHALKALVPDADARRIADGIAAMIDGYYIRAALRAPTVDRSAAVAQVTSCLNVHLASSPSHAETETA